VFNKIENFVKVISENIAREVNRKDFFKIIGGGVFMSMVTIITKSPLAYAAPGSWAEVCQLNTTSCSPPYNTYCTTACKNGISGATSKCPTGYNTSYAWGYSQTGCWCINRATIMCCDCTKGGNSPFKVNPGDCGCKHYVD
jgi:hypothetical protein